MPPATFRAMLMLPIYRRTVRSGSCWSVLGRILLALSLLACIGAIAHADVVYLKDGTVLYGRVVQTRTTIHDDSGLEIGVPAGDGVFGVFDGVRCITFSRFQIDPNRGKDGIDTTDSF